MNRQPAITIVLPLLFVLTIVVISCGNSNSAPANSPVSGTTFYAGPGYKIGFLNNWPSASDGANGVRFANPIDPVNQEHLIVQKTSKPKTGIQIEGPLDYHSNCKSDWTGQTTITVNGTTWHQNKFDCPALDQTDPEIIIRTFDSTSAIQGNYYSLAYTARASSYNNSTEQQAVSLVQTFFIA